MSLSTNPFGGLSHASTSTPERATPTPGSAPSEQTEVGECMLRLLSAIGAVDRRFEHVSIAHPTSDRTTPIAATSTLATTMASTQLRLDSGGLTETLRTGLPVIVTAADRPQRFPAMLATARQLEIDLQLAVPLLQGDRTVGALSLYSCAPAEVDLSMLELAEALAAQAAVLVEQDRLIHGLEAALMTRQQIGQACGVLMSRFLLDGEQAFEALRRASQNRNVKVRDLALEVLREGTLAELENAR